MALLLSRRWLLFVLEWKEVSSRLVWVRVKIERDGFVFMSACGPGSEKSEAEFEGFWNELNEFVRSFGIGMSLWLCLGSKRQCG